MRKANQAKIDLWMSRIMACRKSGLPDVRWCKENGIATSSLYYWINKLRMDAPEIPAPNHDISIPFKQDIVPLRVMNDIQIPDSAPSIPSTAIVIKLEGIALEIQNGANETTIMNTINALRRLC